MSTINKKVRIGILGCANIAERYAIKAFQAIGNAEVRGIASRDTAKAKEWASRFSSDGDIIAHSYDSLIVSQEIDAVYIPLPIGLHKEWVLKAAAEKKHVLCEKSLAESFASAKEIVESCRGNGVVLYENFMGDFHPQHEKVLSLISAGAIGRPFLFESRFGFPPLHEDNIRYDQGLGGGSLNDAGAYTVFMARKILRNEPLAITCALFRDRGKNVDTGGSAMLEFPDGQTAFVAFSFDAMYQNNYSVWGARGLAKVDRAYSIPPDMKPIIELVTNTNHKETTSVVDAPAANHFELIFYDFCDTVLNQEKRGDKIGKTYARLMTQARILEAMRVAAKENRKVFLKEIV
ncbi:MAG: Gfo/Idh/MocA family oxidoreductase [bacterium]|nr:Gfo/Idh/MocA family oxidoreductase [bacterium]